jgi:hypothetical protein
LQSKEGVLYQVRLFLLLRDFIPSQHADKSKQSMLDQTVRALMCLFTTNLLSAPF